MYMIDDWITIIGYSKHKLATKKHVVLPDKIREISYHTPTSPSRPLSSVPISGRCGAVRLYDQLSLSRRWCRDDHTKKQLMRCGTIQTIR